MYLADNGLPDAPIPVDAPVAAASSVPLPDADEPFDEFALAALPLPDPLDALVAKFPEPEADGPAIYCTT